MKKNKLTKINKILEMPVEVVTNEPKVTCLSFKKILIENYKSILEYQDFFIRIKTARGIISVNGLNMKMEEMTQDDVMIEGDIEGVEFEKIDFN